MKTNVDSAVAQRAAEKTAALERHRSKPAAALVSPPSVPTRSKSGPSHATIALRFAILMLLLVVLISTINEVMPGFEW
jgi:hypothetical protein